MTPRTKALGLAVTMSAGLLLSACGSGGKADPTPSPTAAATTTVTTVTGPQAFLADVAATGFGEKDASDPAFLTVGNTACQGLSDGVSYGQQVQAFVESDAKPTQAQAEALVRSAVANLCPEYQAMLPS
jgi:hypothetical protein